MIYKTRRGDFKTLVELQYAYLTSGVDMCLDQGHAGANEWDDKLLHASEVGYCPRMQMLRISGAPKKVQANLTKASEAAMFWVANRLHALIAEAMDWAGILKGYEVSLLDPPWAGRCDALFTPDINSEEVILYDRKTVRGQAMKYSESFPKEAHCLQLGAYATKLPHVERGMIEVVDRSGSVPPIECVIDLAAWREKAAARMESMEEALAALPELPPTLPESFVAHYTKKRNQPYKELSSVTLDCSFECGYCAWHHTDMEDRTLTTSPCKPPNHSPIVVAKRGKGAWTYPNQKPGLDEFLASMEKTIPLVGGQEES